MDSNQIQIQNDLFNNIIIDNIHSNNSNEVEIEIGDGYKINQIKNKKIE